MQRILLVLTLLLVFFPFKSAAAASMNVMEISDPYNIISSGPTHKTGVSGSDGIYFMFSGKRAVVINWTTYNDDFTQIGTDKTKDIRDSGYAYTTGIGFNCNSNYIGTVYDGSGNQLIKIKGQVRGLVSPSCDSGGETDDEHLPNGGIDCDICAALQDIKGSLNGSNDKLDQIIDKIPPPPNWQEVANTMRDTIVPKLVGDTKDMLDDLLGRAPAPPPAPQQPDAPADLDMPNFGDMPDAPSVDLPPEEQDNNFTADDVIKDAPAINYEEPDEADEGFDLSVDPYKHLDDPGSPGTPKEPDDPGSPGTPNQDVDAPPKPDVPNYDPGSPGTPNQDVGAPGKPNDNNLKPSNPGDNIGAPPGEYNPN